MVSAASGDFLFRLFDTSRFPVSPSSNICTVSLVEVLRFLRLDAVAVISLSTCLDAPIRPPLFSDDFGVKKRVNDLGVIVGGLRGLLPCWLPKEGRTGDDLESPPSADNAVLGGRFSCDPKGVKLSIGVVQRAMIEQNRQLKD